MTKAIGGQRLVSTFNDVRRRRLKNKFCTKNVIISYDTTQKSLFAVKIFVVAKRKLKLLNANLKHPAFTGRHLLRRLLDFVLSGSKHSGNK